MSERADAVGTHSRRCRGQSCSRVRPKETRGITDSHFEGAQDYNTRHSGIGCTTLMWT